MITSLPFFGVFLLLIELGKPGKPGAIAFSTSICNNLRKSMMFLDCQSRRCGVAASSTRLYLHVGSAKANNDTPIEDAYRTAQQFDEEWYATVLSDILGVEKLDDNEIIYEITENSPSAEIDADESTGNGNSKEAPLSTQSTVVPSSPFVVKDGVGPFGEGEDASDKIEQHCEKTDGRKYASTSSEDDEKTPRPFNEAKYVDHFDKHQVDDVEVLLYLGYGMAEIQRLRSFAVEKIVQSGLQRPKEGIPKSWTVQSDASDTVRKSTSLRRGRSDESSSRRSRIQNEETSRLISSNADRRISLNSSNSGRRRELNNRDRRNAGFSRASDDSFNIIGQDEFWMDLETFSSFLRKEAQFRLSILGPGWSEAVKGESQWRLQIYKKWLAMMNKSRGRKSIRDVRTSPNDRTGRVRQKGKNRKGRRQRTQRE
uniref:Uncharacterized protein n=1 Tax=Minutocellus polymorphus TaxID=265543 RepID=A0A7S0AUD4_9STRA|mmetsp:Transcript_4432/g.7573  ORF Transcript_4432/g.7573 Transcript_4432/m.7573 type:complete len:427 (+) Transcript_4432:214-1494(+)